MTALPVVSEEIPMMNQISTLIGVLSLATVAGAGGDVRCAAAPLGDVVAIAHTYEVRIRLDGRVSTVRVQANDGGHAKKLVKAQYGDKVTVLSAKRVD
jgi:hypothetical protein